MTVEGSCDPTFAAVRETFAAAVAAGDDLGAAVAVSVGGRLVVDLWGGVADRRTGRAWQHDTACVTFSCTKAVTATAALLLAERGRVDLESPVARWWPEFAADGKATVTGAELLSHQAGLPGFDRKVTVEQAADFSAMAALLASQEPAWPPGTAHGYHAITFGWLAGELVRRASGEQVRDFVRREIGAGLSIGVAPHRLADLARIVGGPPLPVGDPAASPAEVGRVLAALQDPSSLFMRSIANPAVSFNDPALLTACWPAANLVTTARELADFYRRLIGGDIVAPETLRGAVQERVRGTDRTLLTESAFGLGFMLPSPNMWLPPVVRPTAFGHPGASGALGLGDLEHGVAFAYTPNLSRPALGDRRAYWLLEAVYTAL